VAWRFAGYCLLLVFAYALRKATSLALLFHPPRPPERGERARADARAI